MTDAQAVFRRFYDDVVSQGRLDIVDEICNPAMMHHSAMPGQAPGAAGLRDAVAGLRSAFSQFTMTPQDVLVAGDKVVGRFRVSGVHDGDAPGLPATGRSFEFDEIAIVRIDQGRIAELWSVVDRLSLLQQLGAVSVPEDR